MNKKSGLRAPDRGRVIRQFFCSVPFEMGDAAQIDSCSHLGVWAFSIKNDIGSGYLRQSTGVKTFSAGLQTFTGEALAQHYQEPKDKTHRENTQKHEN